MQGEISVSGAKNAAVAIIPAALISDGVCVIDNIPDIDDVEVLAETLRSLGAKVDTSVKGQITIDPTGVILIPFTDSKTANNLHIDSFSKFVHYNVIF